MDDPRHDINTEANNEEAVISNPESKNQDIALGLELQKMTNTGGWVLLKAFLEKKYDAESFMNTNANMSLEQQGLALVYIRERAKAFKVVITWVENSVKKAQGLLNEQSKKGETNGE